MPKKLYNIPIHGTVLAFDGKHIKGDKSDIVTNMEIHKLPGKPEGFLGIDNLEYKLDEGYCVCLVEASQDILDWLDDSFKIKDGETESEVEKEFKAKELKLTRKDLE